MRILLVEDEIRLSENIKKGLMEIGFAVDVAFDGDEGLFLATAETYDCLILDVMLPKLDGIKICQELRLKNIKTPILILTARSSIEDIALGLDSGADDYLTKPFSFVELKSRIQALLRRSQTSISPTLNVLDLELNPIKHTVKRAGYEIDLTPKEFAILEYLMRHQDEVITRTMIIEHVWDINYDSISNVVDAFMATLRKKIDRNHTTKLIQTIHGIGFKLSSKL